MLTFRQQALKLFMNVCFGYTGASATGHMPAVDLADTIMHIARQCVETAISHVNQHATWQARVVYGDTDSLFVSLKGRSIR